MGKPKSGSSRRDDDDDELELTPEEIRIAEIRARLAELGGSGKAEIYRCVPGVPVPIRVGTLQVDEVLDDSNCIGSTFGGGRYKVDLRASGGGKTGGTYIERGREYAFDPLTYGAPRSSDGGVTASPTGGSAASVQLETQLREENLSLRKQLAEKDALIRDMALGGKAQGPNFREQVTDTLKFLEGLGYKPGGSANPLEAEVVKKVLDAGITALRQKGDPGSPLAQMGLTALDKLAGPLGKLLERAATGGHSRGPNGNGNGGGNGNGHNGKSGGEEAAEPEEGDEMSPAKAKVLAKLIGPQVFTMRAEFPNATPEEGKAKVYELVDRRFDDDLFEFCKDPEAAADLLVAECSPLKPHRDWLVELAKCIMASMVPAS